MSDVVLLKTIMYWVAFGGILFFSVISAFCNKLKLVYSTTIIVSVFLSIIYLFLGAIIFSVFQLIFAVLLVLYLKNKEKMLCSIVDTFKTFNARFYFIIFTFGLLFISLFYFVTVSLSLSKSDIFMSFKPDETINTLSIFFSTIFNNYFILLIILTMIFTVVVTGILAFSEKAKNQNE